MAKVKITVLKRFKPSEVFGNGPPVETIVTDACDRFYDGQEFVSEDGKHPEGFPCAWAWNDLYPVLFHLRFGGDFPWVVEKGTILSCCTDGFRPVIFKLQRLEE